MKKLLWLLLGIPAAVLLIVFCVANRQLVTVRLDPFSASNPAIAATLPLFVFLFLALIAGIFLGGFAAWLAQGKYRKTARRERARANRSEQEVEVQKQRAQSLLAETAVAPPRQIGQDGAARAA
jgi:uncharacterized integral membrane protein